MKKRLTLLFSILFCGMLQNEANSQCGITLCTVPIPSYDAPAACILSSEHDLDCYYGQTIANIPISFPPFWCTSIENNQWFAFTASSSNVSFNIEALNCVTGGAIQVALLETVDCVNFNFVSDCLGNIPSGTTSTLTNNVPLTPGTVYYLMIDGSAGAQCDFAINGSSSITSGPSNVCIPGGPFSYFTSDSAEWSILPSNMGSFIGANFGPIVSVAWTQAGTAQICAQNVDCPNVPLFCLNVSIGEYVVAEHTHYLCPGQSVICGEQLFSSPGTYTFNVNSPSGCDSLITCIIAAYSPNITELGNITLPCDGIYTACGETYTNLGQHQAVCTGWKGCDSLVNFNLIAGDVIADAGPNEVLDCDMTTVVLDGSGSSQGSEFTYEWTTTNGDIVGGNTAVMATANAPGVYCLAVTDLATGCTVVDCTAVTALAGGFDVQASICEGDSYDFNGEILTDADVYTTTYTLSSGCDSTVNLTLTVLPPAIRTQILSICEGETIVINGEEISGADTLIYVFTNGSVHGCDSIVNVIVDVLPTESSAFDQNICDGDTYNFNGELLTNAGVYEAIYSAENGCDSVVTLSLMVYPPTPITNQSLEVLQGYIYNGTTINVDTLLTEHLLNVYGCDSTVVTNFTVLPNAIQDLLGQTSFEIFPNPTSGDFTIRFTLNHPSTISLKMLDVIGRTMSSSWSETRFEAGEHLLQINANDWPSGVYFVHFQTDSGMLAQKVVVD